MNKSVLFMEQKTATTTLDLLRITNSPKHLLKKKKKKSNSKQ